MTTATTITAPELIADALVECIENLIGTCDILITGISSFDIERVIRGIGTLRTNGHPIRLAIEGLGDPAQLRAIAESSGFAIPDEFDTTLRAAGVWRNQWAEDDGSRIAIARGLPQRMHTLGQFVEISSAQVAQQLLTWARDHDHVTVNAQHKKLCDALLNDNFASKHTPQLIADYLAALLVLDPVRRLTAVFEQLWRLGLLPDPNLFSGPGSLEKRLGDNKIRVEQIQSADQVQRATINSIASQLPAGERTMIQATLKQIETYQDTAGKLACVGKCPRSKGA